MAIYHEDIMNVELNSGTIARTFLNNVIGEGDDMANRYGVRLFRDGEPVSAEDAEVVGLFMAPNGVNYLISESTYEGSTGTDGNVAWVQLPDDCYAVEGQFSLAIKLGGGSIIGTMRIVDGIVCNTGANGVVGPSGTIPTSEEIIAAFEAAAEVIDGVVRHDVTQSLDSANKARARENIDAVATSRKVNGHALTGDVTVTKEDLGLGNVDNTSDANKPISSAQAAAFHAIDQMTVEGYERTKTPITGTYYQDKYIRNDGQLFDVTNWIMLEIDAEPETGYLITGQGGPVAFVAEDANGNVLGYYQPGANVNITDYPYITPANTAKLFVNRGSNKRPIVTLKYAYDMTDDMLGLMNGVKGVNGMTIEGYEKAITEVSGTLYSGTIWNGYDFVPTSGWSCLVFDAIPNATYWMDGTGNPMISVYDTYGNRIDDYRPGSSVSVENYEYTTGSRAATIYLNRKTSEPKAKVREDYNFIQGGGLTLAFPIGENKYRVGRDLFRTDVSLFGSGNGAFTYDTLTYNGASFKSVNDDVAPMYTDAGYIGANHGYNYGYSCTSALHGLTEADIGKTYSDGSNTWILLKILSENKFLMGCYNSSKWFKLKTGTVPGSVNFGTSVTITASEQVQITPSIKNKSVTVFENSAYRFRVMETYDVIDIGVGITALMSNQGDNTNDSLVELSDELIRVSILYEFNNAGAVTLYEEIELLKSDKVELQYAFGSQAMSFDGYDKFAVLGTTIDELQTSVLEVGSSIWKDQNKAPSVFIKMKSTEDNGFVIAYVRDRTSVVGNNAGDVNSTTKKMYPRMIGNYSDDAAVYSNIVLRMPLKKNSSGADFVSYANVGDDVYIFVGNLTAKTANISVPADIFGKTVSVVDKNDNITVQTGTVTSTIRITTTGEGWALIKVS